MDRQTGDEHRKVQIDAGERGQPKRDGDEIEPIHPEIIRAREAMSRDSNDEIRMTNGEGMIKSLACSTSG